VTPLPAGSGASSIAVGDIDQDGKQDLAVADPAFASTRVWILRGDGLGGFSAPVAANANWDSYSVEFADLDLDGQLDLVIGYFGYNAVQVLMGEGSPYMFRQPFGFPYFIPGNRTKLALADLDRNGHMDVIAETSSPQEVRILLNRAPQRACLSTDGCTTNTCNPLTGHCSLAPGFSSGACDDGNLCTTSDTCVAGACQGVESSGAACEDGSACTLDDTCDVGACAGTPSTGSPEVDATLEVSRIGAVASITWDPADGAITSSVLRGELASLPVGSAPGTEVCLMSRLPASTVSTLDADVAPPGSGYWYLVRGESACGTGSYGNEGLGGVPTSPRTSASCP
jgi:hypothetical protein